MTSGELPFRAAAAGDAFAASDGAPRADSDSSLLSRARRGDRAAFGALVERHHRTMTAILAQAAGPDAPLEDLVQETFARTLVHVSAFRGDSKFVTWATTIGLRVASDWRRREATRRRLAPSAAVAADDVACRRSADGAHAVERRDEADLARRALERLPPEMRAAITLRVVEDLAYEDIAARMDAPMPRVRQWVCRGLAKLRGDPALKFMSEESRNER